MERRGEVREEGWRDFFLLFLSFLSFSQVLLLDCPAGGGSGGCSRDIISSHLLRQKKTPPAGMNQSQNHAETNK